jgi:carbamate kinase
MNKSAREKEAVLNVFASLVRPLTRVAFEYGISASEISGAVRRTYIQSLEERLMDQKRVTTDARIAAVAGLTKSTLWLAVAQTQAEIGALIAAELRTALDGREVACLLTHVTVAPDDPAFDRPTKPIGPFYSAEQAEVLERERGWALVSDANRGHRRVVPSPEPLEIVELDAISRLVKAGTITIACGGGGIPVARREGRLSGVDAVIDKDRASALLARELLAERLIILTEVPAVYRNFGDKGQEEIRELSRKDAEALLPRLAEGSMRPKIESAVGFAGETLITSFDALGDALAGTAGTRVGP